MLINMSVAHQLYYFILSLCSMGVGSLSIGSGFLRHAEKKTQMIHADSQII